MSDQDDYGFEPETVHLLKVFQAGGDAMESGLPSINYSRQISDYLHGLTNQMKGQVIIDLLVLSGHLESIILELKMKEFGDAAS